jgi:hypothetical protein
MTCSRWIRVCVDTFDHPSLKGEFDRRSAWLWLIANAAWKDHRTRTRGGMVEIKRGQVLAGLKFLADTWGWSIKRVRTFLGELEAEGMIERGQTKNQYAAVVTICNYDKYQTPTETEATDGASEGQARGKRGASEGQHSTKDTRDNNNNITPTDSPEYVAAREGPTDREPDEIKSAFNGQTATMLSDIVRWMGPHGDEDAARKWLSSLLSINGREATGQAYQMLMTAQAEGQPVARPLAWWSKTAATLKANPQAKPPPPHVTDFREAKRQRDREFFRALGLMS